MDATVLVICRETALIDEIQRRPKLRWRSVFAYDFRQASTTLRNAKTACIVADPYLGGRDSFQEIRGLRARFENIPLVVCGKFPNVDVPRKYGSIGVERCASLEDLDNLLEEIPAVIVRHSFKPDITIFGISTENCSRRLTRALEIVSAELSRNVTVSEIADELAVHRTSLEREFQKSFPFIKLKQVLIGLRFHYATFLMDNQGMKLKDIARLVGFANEYEFYRGFHRHMGLTASKYRKDLGVDDFSVIYRQRAQRVSARQRGINSVKPTLTNRHA
jgi:AraC-like DNA-binding protein